MRVSVLLLSGLLLLASTPSLQAEQAHNGDAPIPGYVDFEALGLGGDMEATVEINIQGALLKLLKLGASGNDPEFADLISDLDVIRVRVFDLRDRGGSRSDILSRMSELSRRLERKGWETIIKVRENNEHAYILMKMDGDLVEGLTVMAMDEDQELVVVNIAGIINMEEVWRLGEQFNIDQLDSLKSYERRAKHPEQP